MPYECRERPIPYPLTWGVRCPSCERAFEYEPVEDESGVFGFDPAEWPTCEDCDVMFDPVAVQVIAIDDDAPREGRSNAKA